MVKKFTIPFASQGDANDIPDALQVDGKVSFTQGFGYDYERPYDDPQAKDIAREDMNGLFKAITSAVGELQTLGASEWSSAISYPKGAIVYYEKDLYISQVDDNQNKPPQSWVSITSIANDSLKKAANLSDLTNKATARNNLGLGSSATLNKTDVLGTSTSLVATQKLVNDTKINLESSKQDKLTFVGDGPEVMKTGAYGLGGNSTHGKRDNFLDILDGNGFFGAHGDGKAAWEYSGISLDHKIGGLKSVFGVYYATNTMMYKLRKGGSDHGWYSIYSDANTSIDSSGFLRASGSKETFTKDLVTQSTGSSTTNVMSQKAVTDQLNAIKSGHGLGYGQSWVDVTANRALETTYTNTTGRTISVSALINCASQNARVRVVVDGVPVMLQEVQGTGGPDNSTTKALGVTAIVPNGSTYRYTSTQVVGGGAGTIFLEHSAELR